MAIVRQPNAVSFNFKSAGRQTSEVQEQSTRPTISKQIGIKTPVRFDDIGPEFVAVHDSIQDQVHDNLINLLLTNHGERLGLPDFGANLMELCFEMQHDEGQQKAIKRINHAVGKYMPYVIPKKFQPVYENFQNKEVAKVGVKMTYDVPRLGVQDKGLEIILYGAG
tara:strand:- start:1441 stop:1938 length:498 start_codon:yes stop_codon:yes gene_type:complete